MQQLRSLVRLPAPAGARAAPPLSHRLAGWPSQRAGRGAKPSSSSSSRRRLSSRVRCNADSPPDGTEPTLADYQLPWETEPPALPPGYAALAASIGGMDSNQLQTALGVAIAAEDYALATRIKERLQARLAESGSAIVTQPMDWRVMGVPPWLADRAERLGLLFPTEVQRRATPVILSGSDAIIASETGSGKTAAFLIPALSQLDYPPHLFPEDLEGPQLLLLVPSFELGVQACMLLYKLWGGNISSRTPGDPANMFNYDGPAGIKVRGLLNDEEVELAATSRYLRGVHALVATPDMALALLSLPNSTLSFQDLRVIAVDEMDALLDAYPASFGQLLDAAVSRHVPPGFNDLGGGLTAMGLDQLGQPDGSEDGSSSSGGDAQQQQDQQQGKQADKQQQDNLAKLKALLSEQQQRNKQQQGQQAAAPKPGVPGLPGSSSGSGNSSASLAAAAARLEGLLAAPPAEGSGTQPQQQQAPGSEQQEAGAEAAPSSLVTSNTAAAAAAVAAAAAGAGVDLDDDTPMPKPQVILVGATISESDISLAMARGWISPEPVVVRVGAEGCVPSGLVHRAIVVSGAQQRLGGLVASLRRDLSGALAAADAAAAAAAADGGADSGTQQPEAAAARPVRVIIFARSEAEARSAAEPLRAALWGDHMLSVLLPSTGAEPVKAITAFRDRVASLLLCTPSAARGLDLPAVSHVYSIGLPQDATEYVHRAGRAGRIGSTTGGEVVSVVTPEELPALLDMVSSELGLHLEVLDLAQQQQQQQQQLGLLSADYATAREELLREQPEQEQAEEGPGGAASDAEGQGEGGAAADGQKVQQLDAARRGLEDLFNLL